jgi:hypothetical protein
MPSEHLEGAIANLDSATAIMDSDHTGEEFRRVIEKGLDATNALIAAVQRLERMVEGRNG